MSEPGIVHQGITWAKAKLDEVDALIAEIDRSAEALTGQARQQADEARRRLVASRDRFQSRVDIVRQEAVDVKDAVEGALVDTKGDVEAEFERDWVEIESAFQSFLAAAAGQAGIVQAAIVARANAQRQFWRTSIEEVRNTATKAIDAASSEVAVAIQRVTEEADKIELRLDQVSTAGDDSWKAIKQGVGEMKETNARTISKVREALSRLF